MRPATERKVNPPLMESDANSMRWENIHPCDDHRNDKWLKFWGVGDTHKESSKVIMIVFEGEVRENQANREHKECIFASTKKCFNQINMIEKNVCRVPLMMGSWRGSWSDLMAILLCFLSFQLMSEFYVTFCAVLLSHYNFADCLLDIHSLDGLILKTQLKLYSINCIE